MANLKNPEEMKAELKALVEENLGVTISDGSEDLVASGKIDSYTMLLLITHVRDSYQVELDMDDLNFDDFQSMDRFVSMVCRVAGS